MIESIGREDPSGEARQTADPLVEPRLKAIGLMGLAVVAWTLASLAGQVVPGTYSPYQIVWERYGWHLVFLLVVIWPRRGGALWHSKRPWLQLFRATTMVLMPLLFVASVPRIGGNDFWAFFWVAPLGCVILAPLLLHESLSLVKTTATLGAFLGMLMMFRPDLGGSRIGIASALGAGLCLSVFLLLSRSLKTDSALTGLLYTALCVFLAMSPVQPWVWLRPTIQELAGVFSMSVAWFLVLYLFDEALGLAPVIVLVPYLFLEPVLSSTVAYLIFGTSPDAIGLIGGCLILVAVTAVFVRDALSARPR